MCKKKRERKRKQTSILQLSVELGVRLQGVLEDLLLTNDAEGSIVESASETSLVQQLQIFLSSGLVRDIIGIGTETDNLESGLEDVLADTTSGIIEGLELGLGMLLIIRVLLVIGSEVLLNGTAEEDVVEVLGGGIDALLDLGKLLLLHKENVQQHEETVIDGTIVHNLHDVTGEVLLLSLIVRVLILILRLLSLSLTSLDILLLVLVSVGVTVVVVVVMVAIAAALLLKLILIVLTDKDILSLQEPLGALLDQGGVTQDRLGSLLDHLDLDGNGVVLVVDLGESVLGEEDLVGEGAVVTGDLLALLDVVVEDNVAGVVDVVLPVLIILVIVVAIDIIGRLGLLGGGALLLVLVGSELGSLVILILIILILVLVHVLAGDGAANLADLLVGQVVRVGLRVVVDTIE